MDLRSRNSPEQKTDQISNVDETGTDKEIETVPVKKRSNFGRTFALFLMFVGMMGLVFIMGVEVGDRLRRKSTSIVAIPPAQPTVETKKKKYDLKIHWEKDPVVYQKEGDKDSDVCELLSNCFASFAPDPVKYPKNPLQYCHNYLKYALNAYDHGFYFDGPRLVGFVSAETNIKDKSPFAEIAIYNVCVRKEDRGKGIPKAMIPEFINQVVPKRVPNIIPRTYVGLSVNFETESSASAFTVYSKLGFNRWWETCTGMGTFDFSKVEQQFLKSHPVDETKTIATFDFPMSKFFLRRAETLKDTLVNNSEGKPKHSLCMIMLHGVDDFNLIGRDIRAAVQKKLAAA